MHVIVAQRDADSVPLVVSNAEAAVTDLRTLCGQMIDSGMARVTLHELNDQGFLVPLAWMTKHGQPVEDGGRIEDDTDVKTEQVSTQSVEGEHSGYCFSCKAKRKFDGHVSPMANGQRRASGTCPVCGKGISGILPKPDDDEEATVSVPVRTDWSTPAEDEEPNPDDDPDPHLDDEDDTPEVENPDDDPDVPGLDETITEAITEAVEGQPAEVVAEATQQVAIEFSEAAAVADTPIQLTDEQKAATKPTPRKRTSKKATSTDKDAEQTVEAARVAGMKTAECPNCQTRQPVSMRHGIATLMAHSSEGNPECKGSRTVVNQAG